MRWRCAALGHDDSAGEMRDGGHLIRQGAHQWGPLLGVLGLVLLGAIACTPSMIALHGLWTDTDARTYTHGYLIAAVSAGLLLRSANEFGSLAARPVPGACGAVFLLSLLWLVAWRACLQDLHLVLWPPLVLTATLAAFGWNTARLLLFPLGLLYFAFPVWGDLNDWLQGIAVQAVNALVWLTGLPAYVEGDLVHVPAGTLQIAAGCSGLHFLIVGLAIAALYGELRGDGLARRMLYLACMGALAIVGNALRVFTIAVVAYATAMRGYLVAVDHYWFGWLVFVGALLVFLRIADRLRHRPAADAQATPIAAPPLDHGQGLQGGTRPPLPVVPAWLAAGACLIAAPALEYVLDWRSGRSAPDLQIEWPQGNAQWGGPEPAGPTLWGPVFRNASVSGLRTYVSPADGATVEVFCVAYSVQRQSGKLFGYASSIVGRDTEFRVVSENTARTPGSTWRSLRVADASGGESLIWVRYRIGQRNFISPWRSQLAYGIAALEAPPVSSLIALHAQCKGDCEAAWRRLEDFAGAMNPRILVTRPERKPRLLSECSALPSPHRSLSSC